MSRKLRRTLAAVITVAALSATFAWSVVPAGATVAAANDKFCALFSDQGAGIDFEGLGPDEAAFAAKLFRKAAKTGVPKKLKKDLKKLVKVYDEIADGKPAIEVLDAKRQAAVLPALTRFGQYVAANCIATPPST
jgi:hypothetical protein